MVLPGESLCKQTSHLVVETLNSHVPGFVNIQKKRHSNMLNLAFGLSNFAQIEVTFEIFLNERLRSSSKAKDVQNIISVLF